jgi:hypothetical protein
MFCTKEMHEILSESFRNDVPFLNRGLKVFDTLLRQRGVGFIEIFNRSKKLLKWRDLNKFIA